MLPEDGQAPPARPLPYGLKKYRERGFSTSGPQEPRTGEFEVRYVRIIFLFVGLGSSTAVGLEVAVLAHLLMSRCCM